MAVKTLSDPPVEVESFDEADDAEEPIHAEPDRLSSTFDSVLGVDAVDDSAGDVLLLSITATEGADSVSLDAGATSSSAFFSITGACASAFLSPASATFGLVSSSSKTFFGRGGSSIGIGGLSSVCCDLSSAAPGEAGRGKDSSNASLLGRGLSAAAEVKYEISCRHLSRRSGISVGTGKTKTSPTHCLR